MKYDSWKRFQEKFTAKLKHVANKIQNVVLKQCAVLVKWLSNKHNDENDFGGSWPAYRFEFNLNEAKMNWSNILCLQTPYKMTV